jgi:hypothetical protein
MKKPIIYIAILLYITLFTSISKAQNTVELTLKFVVSNTIEGYDHVSKLIVYCDGNQIGESSAKKQSISNSVTVKVPTGNHNVKAILNKYTDGVLEERTIANNYSLDFIYDKYENWQTNKNISLTFDIKTTKVIIDEKETNGNTISSKSNSTRNYQTALKKLNDYLKTFDNGYYGYFEVINDEIFIRLKAGTYCSALISDLDKAYVVETNKKIEIRCLGGENCMNATYTKGKTTGLKMYQDKNFDSEEFIQLINDLISTLKKSNSNTFNSGNKSEITQSEISEPNSANSNNNASGYSTSTENYQTALKKVNEYLKTFDNGYYGYLEIKDGFLYDKFPSGKYSKSEIKYLGKAYEEDPDKKVSINCIEGKDCVFSTYTDSYHGSIGFSQTYSFNTSELITLLDNLIAAYKKSTGNYKNDVALIANYTTKNESINSTKITTTSNSNYKTALQKLNDYLKTFDNGYYGYFEVKDGYIYDRFKAGKYNKFKMEDMEGAIVQPEYSRVIFKCKSGNCISTDWKENGKEEYTQFTKGSAYNYKELADLLNNFKDAYLGKKQTSTNNSTVSANKSREEKAKERQQPTSKTNDDDLDEDWDALEKAAAKLNNSTKEVKESTGTLRSILYDKEIILTDIDNSDPNFDKAKKYIGKKGKTKTYIIPNDDNLTFYGDIYFDGILFKFKKIRIKEVTANENTSSTSSNNKYTEPLKKLNDYLKTFNSETYRDIEVKDGKVYFAFFVYGAKFNSSIGINELKNNTIITIGKSVGSFKIDEVKISCKGDSKCFYSQYSKGTADHFRFFSNTVTDFTKIEQLVKDFIKAL